MDPRRNGPDQHAISQSHHHGYAQQPVYSTWRYDQDHIYGHVRTSFSWERPPGRPENDHETRGRGLEQESELERDTSRSTSPAGSYCPSASADSDDKLYPWQPGFVKRFPYMGLVPLLLSIACTVVSISIILVSNDKLVNDWSGVMQPGVLLAYSSTVANTLLGFSFAYGWATQFWVRAVSGRMRLTDLYYHYEGATSVWGAINSLARGRVARVSLVSLLVTVTSLLRGPLMQRALVVETREMAIPGTIDLEISPYSDIMSGDLPIPKEIPTASLRVPGVNSGYQEALRGFQAKTPIHLRGAESCSNCSLAVTAFGFDYSDCITSTATVDLDTLLTEKRRSFWVDTFHIDITKGVIGDLDHYRHGEGILVNVTRKTTTECNGAKLVNQLCWLKTSIVSYDLNVNGGNATFVSDSWTGDSIVKPVKASDPGQMPKIEFLSQSASQLWDAQITMPMTFIQFTPEGPRSYFVMNDPPRKGLASYIYYNQKPGDYNLCSPTFDDPMDDILKSFRELVLRLAIVDAVEWNAFAALTNSATNKTSSTLPLAQQRVPYQSHQVRVLYAAQITALVLATVISLLGPLATMFLFWGWWNLGRDFSMNPLELVNALLVRGTGMGPENGASHQDCHSQQQQQQVDLDLASLPLLLSGSSNASRAQVVDHVRKRIRGTRGSVVEKEKEGDGKENVNVNMIEVGGGRSSASSRRSSSASASRKGRSRMKEPIIQYGVLDSTGRLGFAVADAEGVIRARCPRRGEML